MEKRKMENLGIETSLLGFGCMRFPVMADGKIDEAQAERMLDIAISKGVNYIDTAYPYHDGLSEVVVGKILKKYERSSFYLATKLPVWLVNTVEDVDRYFEEQLKKLQVEYIDFYLMHAMNKERWEKMKQIGCVKRLEELKAEGKIKYLGFSFHDSYEVFEEILCSRNWDFCQIQLNYMDTEEQAGLKGYQLATDKKIPLVIMEPVKGGNLVNLPEDAKKILDVLHGGSPASYALRFAAGFEGVLMVLSGMSTLDQMEDNISFMKEFKPLNEKELEAVHQVADIFHQKHMIPCTACRYCVAGCPKHISIPDLFSCMNAKMVFHDWNADYYYNMVHTARNGKASECVKCGKCEKVCPQHLRIREILEDVAKEFEKPQSAAE